MASDKHHKKNHLQLVTSTYEDDTTDTDSGDSSGAAGSEVAFADFIGTGKKETFAEILSREETRDLLLRHPSAHELGVKKQKANIDAYAHKRAGTFNPQAYGQSLQSAGQSSQYKEHPALKNLSGMIDPQVANTPNDSMTKTNDEKRHELRPAPTPHPSMQPSFNPKPKPPTG